jgi:hypothetical protein
MDELDQTSANTQTRRIESGKTSQSSRFMRIAARPTARPGGIEFKNPASVDWIAGKNSFAAKDLYWLKKIIDSVYINAI